MQQVAWCKYEGVHWGFQLNGMWRHLRELWNNNGERYDGTVSVDWETASWIDDTTQRCDEGGSLNSNGKTLGDAEGRNDILKPQ